MKGGYNMQVNNNNYNLVLVTAKDGKYIFTGFTDGENPTLELIRGETYTFEVQAAGHPLWIKTERSTGIENSYNEGVINNGVQTGTLGFRVPDTAPSQLFYNCQFHDTMQGIINISDPDIEDLVLRYKESLQK
jgi:hypothetical protein